MTIELPGPIEEQLRNLAFSQGRDLRDLVEEAVQQYLEGAAITDVDTEAVGETQDALVSELSDISDWHSDKP